MEAEHTNRSRRLGRRTLSQPADQLAPQLLGKLLCRRTEGGVLKYRIMETECYLGEEDTACHASRGRTERTRVLYEKGGTAYVYLCYGIHALLNVVSGRKGHPEAVLIRGVSGYNGPGKLTRAMEIDRTLNEEDMVTSSRLWLEDDGYRPEYIRARRVGIDYATEEYRKILWRFIVAEEGYRAAGLGNMEIIYGTGNKAKIAYMQRALSGLPIKIRGTEQVLDVEESGSSPLENARQKAESYYRLFGKPVFSCDSGLYLWNHTTGEPLPDEEQPGVHVRGRGAKRLSDEELLSHYIGLVRKYGKIRARYRNAICLIWDEEIRAESMDESLGGEEFLFTDVPHAVRMEGFPLDSISLDLRTGKYYLDMEDHAQDSLVSDEAKGFRDFFRRFLEEHGWGEDFCRAR